MSKPVLYQIMAFVKSFLKRKRKKNTILEKVSVEGTANANLISYENISYENVTT